MLSKNSVFEKEDRRNNRALGLTLSALPIGSSATRSRATVPALTSSTADSIILVRSFSSLHLSITFASLADAAGAFTISVKGHMFQAMPFDEKQLGCDECELLKRWTGTVCSTSFLVTLRVATTSKATDPSLLLSPVSNLTSPRQDPRNCKFASVWFPSAAN